MFLAFFILVENIIDWFIVDFILLFCYLCLRYFVKYYCRRGDGRGRWGGGVYLIELEF